MTEEIEKAMMVEVSQALAEIPVVAGRPFEVMKAIYDTNKVAIFKGGKIYRLDKEVDFRRVLVITVTRDRYSFPPIYVAVPERPPERNVTHSVVQGALEDAGLKLAV